MQWRPVVFVFAENQIGIGFEQSLDPFHVANGGHFKNRVLGLVGQ